MFIIDFNYIFIESNVKSFSSMELRVTLWCTIFIHLVPGELSSHTEAKTNNGCRFADDIFKCIVFWLLNKISVKYGPYLV